MASAANSSGVDIIVNFEQVVGLGLGDLLELHNFASSEQTWDVTIDGSNAVFSYRDTNSNSIDATVTVFNRTGLIAGDDYVITMDA